MACVLVVEDNAVNLRLVTVLLQNEGHSVEPATDAEQALELLGRIIPELILLDVALPGMDGLALARKLKADARFESIPIVALTALAMKGDDQRAYEAGCDDYVSKPIDTRKFPQQIARWLNTGTRSAGERR